MRYNTTISLTTQVSTLSADCAGTRNLGRDCGARSAYRLVMGSIVLQCCSQILITCMQIAWQETNSVSWHTHTKPQVTYRLCFVRIYNDLCCVGDAQRSCQATLCQDLCFTRLTDLTVTVGSESFVAIIVLRVNCLNR